MRVVHANLARSRPLRRAADQIGPPHHLPFSDSRTSRSIELEPLDLRVEVRGWDHVREINRHPDVARAVRARDHAAVLADELQRDRTSFPTA